MNKHQRHNSQLAREFSDTISDISDNFSIGLITPVQFINQIGIISQAIKADISRPVENWAIIRKINNFVICDLFESALEAANELNRWPNKNEFKIDKI